MNIVSKFYIPSSNGLGGMMFEDGEKKGELVSSLMAKMFVEQLRLHRVR